MAHSIYPLGIWLCLIFDFPTSESDSEKPKTIEVTLSPYSTFIGTIKPQTDVKHSWKVFLGKLTLQLVSEFSCMWYLEAIPSVLLNINEISDRHIKSLSSFET